MKTQTIEKTGKKYKAFILVSWAILLTGIGLAVAGNEYCVVVGAPSVPLWIGTKLLAWWNHG